MPVNDDLFLAPATRGDVAGPTIKISIALDAILGALVKLQKGQDINDEIEELRQKSKELDEIFDQLTGWQSK